MYVCMYVLDVYARTLFNFDHEISIFNDMYYLLFLLLHS